MSLPADMAACDYATRLAALKARDAREAGKTQAASWFLDHGFDPECARRELDCPALAGAMDDVLREEAAIRRQMA